MVIAIPILNTAKLSDQTRRLRLLEYGTSEVEVEVRVSSANPEAAEAVSSSSSSTT